MRHDAESQQTDLGANQWRMFVLSMTCLSNAVMVARTLKNTTARIGRSEKKSPGTGKHETSERTPTTHTLAE